MPDERTVLNRILMKNCNYCGREADDTLTARQECGTKFTPQEAAPSTPNFSRHNRTIAIVVALVVLVILMPMLFLVVPVFVLFYMPIYLPFLVSFAIKSHAWRGMRWSLRSGSVLALFIGFFGASHRPDFGNDVAGNIAGAAHNFAWTWGSGIGCAFAAVIVGFLLRVFLPAQPRAPRGRMMIP